MSAPGPGGPPTLDDLLEEARHDLVRLTPAAAAEAVAAGAVLVDIRPQPTRLAEGVIPGAWIVERTKLEWRLDPRSAHRLEAVDDDLVDRVVVLVCDEGYASSLAAAGLRRLGLRHATDLDGGYRAWAAAGLPTAPGPVEPSPARGVDAPAGAVTAPTPG